MTTLSQIRNAGQSRHTSDDKLPTIMSLLSSLRLAELALGDSITAEEHRTGNSDQRTSEYSLVARSMLGRRENIRATIAKLEAELANRRASRAA